LDDCYQSQSFESLKVDSAHLVRVLTEPKISKRRWLW